jgi:hypothetical protein
LVLSSVCDEHQSQNSASIAVDKVSRKKAALVFAALFFGTLKHFIPHQLRKPRYLSALSFIFEARRF